MYDVHIGDIVKAVNGKQVKTVGEYRQAVASSTGNLTLQIARVVEAQAKSPATAAAASPGPVVSAVSAVVPTGGRAIETVVRLNYDEGEQIGVIVENLKVTRIIPCSLAADAFTIGDQIHKINNWEVRNDRTFAVLSSVVINYYLKHPKCFRRILLKITTAVGRCVRHCNAYWRGA